MKTKIYIVVFALLVSKNIYGQEWFKFSVLFDPTIVWIQSDTENVIPDKPRLGFNFGMLVDYYFAYNYAFVTGISIFNTGGTLRYTDGITKFRIKDNYVTIAPDSNIKYNIQYIRIPFALKFKTHMIGRMVYSANMGLNPMMRTSANAVFEDENKDKYNKVNVNDEVNLFNMGWHFGGGTSYSLGGDAAIFAEISFMNTFLDITATANDMITSKNLALRIGIVF